MLAGATITDLRVVTDPSNAPDWYLVTDRGVWSYSRGQFAPHTGPSPSATRSVLTDLFRGRVIVERRVDPAEPACHMLRLDSGAMVVFDMSFDPASETVHDSVDLQEPDEAAEWRDEFLGYPIAESIDNT